MKNLSNISYLDQIRIDHGAVMLKVAFHDIAKNSPAKALQMVNADSLSFACLFWVLPLVHSFGLQPQLSRRNQQAASFCKSPKQDIPKPVLLWIAESGLTPCESDDFDEIIDCCMAELLLNYNDMTVLPTVAELMFQRHQEGRYLHDLEFCFFGSKVPQTMPLVAEYIRSGNQSDNALACQLLNFKPELQPDDKGEQYENFNRWLSENQSFLYPTGESMQQTGKPKHFRVNLMTKYLCSSSTSSQEDAELTPIKQQKQIALFEAMAHDDQKMLAKYSCRIHERDLQTWNRWMDAPMEVQFGIAKAELGGLR